MVFWFVVELWKRIYGAAVVKVSSGLIRGAVERVRGLRERQKVRLAGVVIPGLADGMFSRARGSRFHNRRAGRQQESRASLDSRLLVPWRSHDGISRTSCGHPGAFLARKNSPHGQKMTPPDLPHLMHPVSPVHILTNSE